MNKLLAVNRRVLDVSGRLALLSPNDRVRQIVERAGIHNFLKIYPDDESLERASEDIIKQTSSISLDTVRAIKQQNKEVDFEDFRSEIDRAFEPGDDEPHAPQQPETPVPPQPRSQPRPSEPSFAPPRQPSPPPRAPREQSGFPQQPAGRREGFPPPPPAGGRPEGFAPPPPPSRQAPTGPRQDFGAPGRPPVPPPPGGPRPGMPPQQQPFAQKPPAPPPPPPEPKRETPDDDKLRHREIFEEEEKKKFPVGSLIAVLLTLAVLGGGAYVYLTYMGGMDRLTGKAQTQQAQEQPAPEVPQLAVEEPDSAAAEEPSVDEEAAESEEEEVASATPPARTSRPSPPRRKPAPRRTTPRRRTPAVTNKLTITSTPSGATVRIDGNVKGTTPYTWTNPSVYGGVQVVLERSGYEAAEKMVEYTGGVTSEHFSLDRKAPEPVAKPTPPARKPEPEPAPSKPAPAVASTPEPEPEPATPEPAPAKPAPTPSSSSTPAVASASPAPSSSGSSGGGKPGTIFIASIPPVADVYMDGNRIGKTNIAELKITSGTHTMKFVKGAKEIVKEMTFQPGKNPSQMIRIP